MVLVVCRLTLFVLCVVVLCRVVVGGGGVGGGWFNKTRTPHLRCGEELDAQRSCGLVPAGKFNPRLNF